MVRRVRRVVRGVLVHVRVLVLVLVVVQLSARAHRARHRQEPTVELATQQVCTGTRLK